MKKETIVDLDLDVYGWFKRRERIMDQIEEHLSALFKLHQRTTGDMRRTGCFHVELSLPEVETEIITDNFGCSHEFVLNAVKSQGYYYCCTAPFGEYEPMCKNYTPDPSGTLGRPPGLRKRGRNA